MSTPHKANPTSVASIDYRLDAKFERVRPSHDQVLLSIEEPHLRRRTAALLEAQDELSRLRAEGMLAERDALHLLDERFPEALQPEIRRVVRAILAKITRAAIRFHGAAETLDECLRAFTDMALSMLRLLMETGKADSALAQQKLDKSEAEAAAAWQRIQDERSAERVNARMQIQALQASLKNALQESAALVDVLRQEVAEVEREHQCDSHEVMRRLDSYWTARITYNLPHPRSCSHPPSHTYRHSRRSSWNLCRRRAPTRCGISQPRTQRSFSACMRPSARRRRPDRNSRRF